MTSRSPFKALSPSRLSPGTCAEERTPTLLLNFSMASRTSRWVSSCMRKGEQGLRACSPSPRGPGATPHLPDAAVAPCSLPCLWSSAQNLCRLLHRSPEPLLPAGMGNHQIPWHSRGCASPVALPQLPTSQRPSATCTPAPGQRSCAPFALCPARPALAGCTGTPLPDPVGTGLLLPSTFCASSRFAGVSLFSIQKFCCGRGGEEEQPSGAAAHSHERAALRLIPSRLPSGTAFALASPLLPSPAGTVGRQRDPQAQLWTRSTPGRGPERLALADPARAGARAQDKMISRGVAAPGPGDMGNTPHLPGTAAAPCALLTAQSAAPVAPRARGGLASPLLAP